VFLARPFRISRVAHPIVVALATAAEGVLETLGEIQMDNPVVDPIDVLAGANAVGVTAQNEALLMKTLPKATPRFKGKALGFGLLVGSVVADSREQIQVFGGNPAEAKTILLPAPVNIGPTDELLPFKRSEIIGMNEVKMASTMGHGIDKLVEEEIRRVVIDENTILIATNFKKNIFGLRQHGGGFGFRNNTHGFHIITEHSESEEELGGVFRRTKVYRTKARKMFPKTFKFRRDMIFQAVIIGRNPFNITSHGIFKETTFGKILHLGKFAGINVPLAELDDKKASEKAVPPRQRFAAGHDHGAGMVAAGQIIAPHPLPPGGVPLSTENSLRLFFEFLVPQGRPLVAQVGEVVNDKNRVLRKKRHYFQGIFSGGPVAGQAVVKLPAIVALAEHGQLGFEGTGHAVEEDGKVQGNEALEGGQERRPNKGKDRLARVHLRKRQAGPERLFKLVVFLAGINGKFTQLGILDGNLEMGIVPVGANHGTIGQVNVPMGGLNPAGVAHDRFLRHDPANHPNRQGQEVLNLLDGVDNGAGTVLTHPPERIELFGRNGDSGEKRAVAKVPFDKEFNLRDDAIGDGTLFNYFTRKVTKIDTVVAITVNMGDTAINNIESIIAMRAIHVALLVFVVGSLLSMTPL